MSYVVRNKLRLPPVRIAAVALLVYLILFTILSGIHLLIHDEYDQTKVDNSCLFVDNSCLVCASIGNFLKQFGLAVYRVMFSFLGFLSAMVILNIISTHIDYHSLVKLKARMNN